MYPDVFTPTQTFYLSYSFSSLVSPYQNIYTQHFVMLNKPNLSSLILYISLFIPLITLVVLFLDLWGEAHIHAGSQGKKSKPREDWWTLFSSCQLTCSGLTAMFPYSIH